MEEILLDKFRFGIEHEFAVIKDGEFCDFRNSTFEDFDRVIQEMPVIDSDYPGLRVGDLGIKSKRWYIEGFERFTETGEYERTDPKGFEIRTPIYNSLDKAVETLQNDFKKWQNVAKKYGYTAAGTALNPFAHEFIPTPPLNDWEVAHRKSPEEKTAYIHMLTSGPDISFSHPDFSTEDTIDIGKKLTYYSPYLVPFSFSSPFYTGELWEGLSRRTYYRTGARPAVLVFVADKESLIQSSPTLTDTARVPAEAGRIEFKAFDAIRDLKLFRSLGALLLGVAFAPELEGRLIVPDAEAHQRSATEGFEDEEIYSGSQKAVSAARAALPDDMKNLLDPLQERLDSKKTPAHDMIATYFETGSIMEAITLPHYD